MLAHLPRRGWVPSWKMTTSSCGMSSRNPAWQSAFSSAEVEAPGPRTPNYREGYLHDIDQNLSAYGNCQGRSSSLSEITQIVTLAVRIIVVLTYQAALSYLPRPQHLSVGGSAPCRCAHDDSSVSCCQDSLADCSLR